MASKTIMELKALPTPLAGSTLFAVATSSGIYEGKAWKATAKSIAGAVYGSIHFEVVDAESLTVETTEYPSEDLANPVNSVIIELTRVDAEKLEVGYSIYWSADSLWTTITAMEMELPLPRIYVDPPITNINANLFLWARFQLLTDGILVSKAKTNFDSVYAEEVQLRTVLKPTGADAIEIDAPVQVQALNVGNSTTAEPGQLVCDEFHTGVLKTSGPLQLQRITGGSGETAISIAYAGNPVPSFDGLSSICATNMNDQIWQESPDESYRSAFKADNILSRNNVTLSDWEEGTLFTVHSPGFYTITMKATFDDFYEGQVRFGTYAISRITVDNVNLVDRDYRYKDLSGLQHWSLPMAMSTSFVTSEPSTTIYFQMYQYFYDNLTVRAGKTIISIVQISGLDTV